MTEHNHPSYEQLHTMVSKLFQSQQRQQRWNFFRRVILIVLFIVTLVSTYGGFNKPSKNHGVVSIASGSIRKPHIALIEIKGRIDNTANYTDNIILSIRNAFTSKNSNLAAVMLRIDSSESCLVSASEICEEILYQRQRNPNLRIIAVCEGACMSGGYLIASVCHEIYADACSMIGSINVVSSSFGYVEALKKIGVENRILIAGEAKNSFNNPYIPLKDTGVNALKEILSNLHRNCIKLVRQGRGNRLKENENLFSGERWTGKHALSLGLVDGIGDIHSVSCDVFGVMDMADYSVKPRWTHRVMQFTSTKLVNMVLQHIPLELSTFSNSMSTQLIDAKL